MDTYKIRFTATRHVEIPAPLGTNPTIFYTKRDYTHVFVTKPSGSTLSWRDHFHHHFLEFVDAGDFEVKVSCTEGCKPEKYPTTAKEIANLLTED